MAKPVSEEELQLKKRARRRLIGAVVLVVAVAVVLPMVLDSEPKPTSQEINIQIPSPDAKGFTSKVVPIPAPPAKGAVAGKPETNASDKPAAQATGAPAAKAPPAVAEKAVPKASDPPKDTTVTAKPAPKPEKASAKAPESAVMSKPGTFYIQVTALADAERANQVQRRIIDAGLLSYTEVVAAGKGNVTRVRAGPFATREEAEKAREKLQGAGLEGKVAVTQ